MGNLRADAEKPTTPQEHGIMSRGTGTTPRKRVTSIPQSSSPSFAKKQANDDEEGTHSEPKSSPSAEESDTTRSRAHMRDLSPNGLAERDEFVRKEMAELQFWHEHPDELRAQIRQTHPTYGRWAHSRQTGRAGPKTALMVTILLTLILK
ncbi:hypothetical protein CNMCM8980_005647 [Aspergillus fumigatiaffinis]|nr:hypothetical protein CNMCM8980_005647 [Aspergillus fumigatiaffinis]